MHSKKASVLELVLVSRSFCPLPGFCLQHDGASFPTACRARIAIQKNVAPASLVHVRLANRLAHDGRDKGTLIFSVGVVKAPNGTAALMGEGRPNKRFLLYPSEGTTIRRNSRKPVMPVMPVIPVIDCLQSLQPMTECSNDGLRECPSFGVMLDVTGCASKSKQGTREAAHTLTQTADGLTSHSRLSPLRCFCTLAGNFAAR
jgi:hypothetical protein